MNDEAIGVEIIRIQRWLDGLPDIQESFNDIQEKITELLGKLTGRKERLSVVVSEILTFARKNKISELENKALIELQGWRGNRHSVDLPEKIGYRKVKVLVSIDRFEFNPYMQLSNQELFEHIKQQDGVFQQALIWPDSLTELERLIEKYQTGKSIIASFSSTASRIFPNYNAQDGPVHVYISQSGLESMYESIRQTLINELLST